MTKDEAMKKAAEWAQACSDLVTHISGGISCLDDVTREYIRDSYMKCFNDMTSGKPDGWAVFSPDGSVVEKGISKHGPLNAGEMSLSINYQSQKDKWAQEGWRIVPVKLLVMEEKANE